MSIITCKWEPKEKSLSSSIAVLDLDPVYGTASRISEIKANYYIHGNQRKKMFELFYCCIGSYHRDYQAMMQNLIVFWHIMVTAPSPEMSLL